MAQTPQFLGPDGVYREEFTYSTTQYTGFFTGSIDPDTIYMQISVQGATFVDDPDMISFEGSTFMVPNPMAYPDGLQLVPGLNVIKVRSITTTGSVSKEAVLNVRLIQDDKTSNAGIEIITPTGITVERFDGYVKIGITAVDSEYVTGYNFYAASEEGGGVNGYSRINVATIQPLETETEESITELGTLDVDIDVAADSNGTHLADPQFLRIQGTQENNIGTVLETDFNERLDIPETTEKIRVGTTFSKVETISKLYFIHDRNANQTSTYPAIPVSAFRAIPVGNPLYYTVTALFYDPDGGVEYESAMSIEIPGSPFTITTSVGNFPVVTRQQIVQDYVLSVYRTTPDVAVHPGSTLRDTMIDPFSSEAERLRFILDFIHRAQSPSTLLAIDDPTYANVSLPVERSEYKIALAHAFRLTNLQDVQVIINQAFEQWASNYGAVRLTGQKARGEVIFYMTKIPTASKIIAIGSVVQGGSYNYITTSAAEITLSNIASFYDASTGRYSVRAYIQAENIGTSYNLAAGQISKVRDIQGLFVTNPMAAYGGYGLESNREMVVRVQKLIAGSEIGNRMGYKKLLAAIPRVTEAILVAPGDDLMKRDWDSVRQEHMGGKIDIWIRGSNDATVSDTFAFTFEEAFGVQFEIVGNPQNLTFRALPQDALTPANPIIEMLNFPAHVPRYGLYNATKGLWMTLTGITYTSFDTIQLSSNYNDPLNISLTDVFVGDYRYRTSNKHVMTRQPVTSIDSFSGQVGQTGVVSSSYYDLYKTDPPLLLGRSTRATDYIQVNDVSVPTGIGQVQTVTGEAHVILGEYTEYLNFLGANRLTVAVWNIDRTTQYKPVATGEPDPDYRFIDSEDPATVALGIQRIDTGAIVSGESVLIDYQHDENFTVTYKNNALINITQTELDNTRRLLDDVVTKHAINTYIDITATVVLTPGTSPVTADKAIRTSLLNLFARMITGAPLRQSTVIDTINSVNGVAYVVVPLTKLCKAEDSLVLWEVLDVSDAADVLNISAWSTETVDVYLVFDELTSPTTDGGGPVTEPRSVYRGESAMTLWDQAPNLLGAPLNSVANGVFIIGNGGLVIPGYTDDATLQQNYPLVTDPNERYAIGVSLSKNRLLLAVSPDTDLQDTSQPLSATYIVGSSSGVGNIAPHDIEYLNAGTMSFTYDEDVDA